MLYNPKWEKPETVKSVLLKAANLVRTRGLAKFTQEDKDGRVCLHGAISIAATGKARQSSARCTDASLAVIHLLQARGYGEQDGVSGGGAAGWNNHPGRTAEEVTEVLEAAAATV